MDNGFIDGASTGIRCGVNSHIGRGIAPFIGQADFIKPGTGDAIEGEGT